MNASFYYPANFIGASFFAKFGVPLYVRLDVLFDKQAKVYVAVSKQVPELILEAATLDEIKSEADRLIPELLFPAQAQEDFSLRKFHVSASFA